MAINIHSNYYEDNYNKYECGCCKRCFIVGEELSKDMKLVCPYCQSSDIEMVSASSEESIEDMDMGCLGIHFSLYDDGQFMLYTKREFAQAMNNSLKNGGTEGIPLGAVSEIMRDYCIQRDGRSIRDKNSIST